MSKKKNLKENKVLSETAPAEEEAVAGQQADDKALPAKDKAEKSKDTKQNAKQDKKKKEKKPKERKLAKKAREMSSELKKVTWPGFAEVCKKTGIVLVVVLVFAVVLFGLDTLFGYLFGLLTA